MPISEFFIRHKIAIYRIITAQVVGLFCYFLDNGFDLNNFQYEHLIIYPLCGFFVFAFLQGIIGMLYGYLHFGTHLDTERFFKDENVQTAIYSSIMVLVLFYIYFHSGYSFFRKNYEPLCQSYIEFAELEELILQKYRRDMERVDFEIYDIVLGSYISPDIIKDCESFLREIDDADRDDEY